MSTSAIPLRIDIVSDVVCPWCIIGLKQVEKALTLLGRDLAVETHWHPFQLNPNMPPEGEDTAEHIARKYGSTPEQSRANRQRLSDIGDSLGFAFNYGEGMRIYNTFNAHKLLTIFGSERGWKAQTELKMALFKAYFQDRRDVSDTEVLCDIAEAQGMDRAVAEQHLQNSALHSQTIDSDKAAREMGITGVPFFIFNRQVGLSGAHEAETLLQGMVEAMNADTND